MVDFVDIPLRENGQDIQHTWFNLLREAGIAITSGTQTWNKYTATYAQLANASLSNHIELFSLLAKKIIHAVVIKHNTAFSGGAISAYQISVGIGSNLYKYGGPFDVFQAVGSGVKQTNNAFDLEDFTSATSIRILAEAVGANLDQATQGSVDVYVLTSVLP